MPLYAYRCSSCQSPTTIQTSIANYEEHYMGSRPPCQACGSGTLHRTYEPFPMKMPIPDHYSPTVGRHVSGERDFREALRVASASATERTGIEHNFQPVDMRDPALNPNPEKVEVDNRTRHDSGRPIVPLPK